MSQEQHEEKLFEERQILPLQIAETVGCAAVAALDGQIGSELSMPVNMYGVQPNETSRQKAAQEAQEAARVEALKILDKDAYKLGDLNPLIHPTDLMRKESVDAVRYTIINKIDENDGLMPKVLESAVATDPETGKSALRFIARFEVPNLNEQQLVLLEDLVQQTYGLAVRTRTDSKGNDISPQSYPPTQLGEEMKSKTGGWYMGPGPVPTTCLHQGLYVFRDLGQINKDNFLMDHSTAGKYIVEVRESSQYQTDLVTFVTQVASVLGQEKLLDRGQLLYETYYDLIRRGLKKVDQGSIYGMDAARDMIRRELIIPLANPDISTGVNEEPQSVLMIGVPGTGKTLLVEGFLHDETGLFILPIDPFELQKEVALPKEKQTLLPRIAEIGRITGKRVVLHVDDIENMVNPNEVTNSTMLNLMAGVQESGFYIIASTNYPEKINPSLIQPQRFSILIHCGLQNKQARYEILKIHAGIESNRLKMPLFSSDEVRDLILREVASLTEGFTPRYLANIATVAKSYLVERVVKTESKTIGLTEEELAGHIFAVDDWEKAFAEVAEKYDNRETIKRDEEMAKFVQKHAPRTIGFVPDGSVQRRIFSNAVFERVVAAEAKMRRNDSAAEPS